MRTIGTAEGSFAMGGLHVQLQLAFELELLAADNAVESLPTFIPLSGS